MANVHDDTAGAEHPGFLQKIKDKLHIGHHHKDKVAASPETAVSSKESTPGTDVPASPPVKKEPAIAKPAEEEPAPAPVEESPHHAHPTTDLNSLAGHEAEHHGGVPTFLAALPDQDIPEEVTKETATSSDGQGGEFFDSEEVFSKAQQGEHHEGVPTFLVALPDQDMPDEGTKENLHHVSAEEQLPHSSAKDVDSEELFSNAQQGEHHEGVPTFLVALPEQDMPNEETKEHLHHVSAEEQLPHSSAKDVDSEELFSNAQQGEHHGGVPTFLVALPDQEIPEEVNKGVTATSDVADDSKEEFDSEEVFSKAQQGEHHEGVPTFMVALPDQDMPDEGTKEKLHHVSAEEGTNGVDAA